MLLNFSICKNIIKVCIILLNYDMLQKCITDFKINCIVFRTNTNPSRKETFNMQKYN